MSAIVQAFPKQVPGSQGREGGVEQQGDASAIYNVGNYLPSTTNDQDSGQGNGGGGNRQGDGTGVFADAFNNEIGVPMKPNSDAANVLAALGAPTGEYEKFVDSVTRLPEALDRPVRSKSSNAAIWFGHSEYVNQNAFDVDKISGWGDNRSYIRSNNKFTPLNGKPITFDPNDIGIRFDTPYELAAAHTTVTEEDYNNVYFQQREAHVNERSPRKDRLEVYNLNGMSIPNDVV